MALKVNYNALMLQRVEEILADIELQAATKRVVDREAYAQRTYRLSYDYLRKIGRVHKSPSGRVLDNLGLELWVRNPQTGQEQLVEFDYKCDWTPRDPQPRRK